MKTPVGDGPLAKEEVVCGEVVQGFGLVFGILLNCLDEGKENILMKWAGDCKLGRACKQPG